MWSLFSGNKSEESVGGDGAILEELASPETSDDFIKLAERTKSELFALLESTGNITLLWSTFR